jgi:cobalt/nickel transport protein
MNACIRTALAILLTLCLGTPALAHFGMIIPSDAMVMAEDPRTISLELSFSHPFEQVGMELVKPEAFGAIGPSGKVDLRDGIKPTQVMGHPAWRIDYPVTRPGIHQFYMEPQPYWEPAEDCFIIHYTRTVVAAFGDDEGWDAELGLKTEIVPLAKPFGLYAGNVFQGIVKLDGRPVPYAEVEVEYYNQNGRVQAPTDYMVTQTLKADGNGVFTCAVPKAGWWGFAALNEAGFKLPRDGQPKDVEIGAVLWVHFEAWPENN